MNKELNYKEVVNLTNRHRTLIQQKWEKKFEKLLCKINDLIIERANNGFDCVDLKIKNFTDEDFHRFTLYFDCKRFDVFEFREDCININWINDSIYSNLYTIKDIENLNSSIFVLDAEEYLND